ncbi:hypothetical protein TIFTF001_023936 [Ficus carica]|uniref:Uncharacterized protein n=1 Tax=Ficus carica TaxID=3494 RepID=A0AA88DCX4_FICCA|nr:hypothetical protein TIFTF001_023936 [Ficus carica]
MASFGTSAAKKTLYLMVVSLLLCMTKIMAQDLATPPAPGLQAGAGIFLPVSGALICLSVLISLVTLLN